MSKWSAKSGAFTGTCEQSTAPYITVTLIAPSQAEEKGLVDRDTAIRNSAALVREAAANLA